MRPTPGRRGLALLAVLAAAASLCARASAGPSMSSGANTISRDVDDAGGLASASAANRITASIGEAVVVATAASSANRVRAGWGQIAYAPGAPHNLAVRSDITASSATLQWTTTGYDGGVGAIQAGSKYLVQASTDASLLGDPGFGVAGSTSGTTPGTGVGAGAAGLMPNTTYLMTVIMIDADANVSDAPVAATSVTLASPPSLGAKEFLSIQVGSASVDMATVTVAWAALPLSPPDASSRTAEGYVLQASSNDFGALAPAGAPVLSSVTYSVLASTLTLGQAGTPLDLSSTYYFRIGSLNWAGQPNFTTLPRLNFQVQQSTGLVDLSIDANLVTSTVCASSMVVTNVGNWPATIQLFASTATQPSSPWSLGTSPDVERIALQGVWNPAQPVAGAFNTYLTTTTMISQSAGNYAGGQTGFQLAPGASATLWFRLTLPATTASTAEVIRVTPLPVYP